MSCGAGLAAFIRRNRWRCLDSPTDPTLTQRVALDKDGPPAAAVARFDGQTRTVSWPHTATLLVVLLDEGIDA